MKLRPSPLLVASSTSVEKAREMSSICFAGAVAPRVANVRRAGVAGRSKRVRPFSVATFPGKIEPRRLDKAGQCRAPEHARVDRAALDAPHETASLTSYPH